MINVLGSLLPTRASTPEAPGSIGLGSVSGSPETGTEEGKGSFASTLLQLLTPTSGDQAANRPVSVGLKVGEPQVLEGGPSISAPESDAEALEAPPPPAPEVDDGGTDPTGLPQPDQAMGKAIPGMPPLLPATGIIGGLSISTPEPDGRMVEALPPPAPGTGDGNTGAAWLPQPVQAKGEAILDNPSLPRPTGGMGEPRLSLQVEKNPGAIDSDFPSGGSRDTPRTPTPGAPLPHGGPEVSPTNPVHGGAAQAGDTDGPGGLQSPSGEVLDAPEAPAMLASRPGHPSGAPAEVAFADSFPMNSDPERLVPEFRHRIDRVISRMESEYGHEVKLVEGYRSPDRQRAIYAQGRTQPGPVATWTQESLHSQGRAADLIVDGGWDSPEGFARLQQVAKEEGLGVLGSKDPGHLELPGDGSSGRRASRPGSPSMARGAVPRPARVPRPISARVATAARVARPASPGSARTNVQYQPSPPSGSAGAATPTISGTPLPQPPGLATPTISGNPLPQPPEISKPILPTSPTLEVRGDGQVPREMSTGPMPGGRRGESIIPGPSGATLSGGARGETAAGPLQTPARAPEEDPVQSLEPQEDSGGTHGLRGNARGSGPEIAAGTSGEVRSAPPPRSVTGVDAVQRAGTAERVHEILTMGDAWETSSPGRIHLDLENADGAGTRIRLNLRGSELSGNLDLSDPVLATRMRQRIGELHEALSRQGLDSRALEARAITGVAGYTGPDGDLVTLLKDPLTGLARILEASEQAPQGRGDEQRQARREPPRDGERFRDAPQRERNKENQQ